VTESLPRVKSRATASAGEIRCPGFLQAAEEVNIRLATGLPLPNALRVHPKDFVGKQSPCRFSS
jgi:hypothetical protein